ncbi:MAG: cytosine permease, partial [Oscillospiraceae bacterium]
MNWYEIQNKGESDMEKQTNSNMEKNALSHIPASERQKWYSIAFIWIGTMICIPMLMVGGMLSASMTFANVLIAAFLGFLVCAALMCLVGIQGTDLGLSASMCATKAFGDRGSSYLMSVSIFIGQMGWFGIQTATCSTAFCTLMQYWKINFPFWLSCIIWGGVMLVTAVYGFKLMKYLNYVAVPALMLMCVYGMGHAIFTTGWSNIVSVQPDPANVMG